MVVVEVVVVVGRHRRVVDDLDDIGPVEGLRHWPLGIGPEAAVGDQHLDEVRVADLQRVGVVGRLGIGKV